MRALWRALAIERAPRWFARRGDPGSLSTDELGRLGEALAACELRGRGLRILARRLRTPWLEVDLVAWDGRAPDGPELVCIEVKAARLAAVPRPDGRRLPRLEWRWAPGARVDRERLRRLAGAARWLRAGHLGHAARGTRVDVVEVVLRGRPAEVEVRWHPRVG